MMGLGLKNKIVMVTGGTRGIGRAIVEAFLAEGACVHYCARNAAAIKAADAELAPRGRISGAVVDVSNQDQVKGWLQDTVNSEGAIDVVVSNVSSFSLTDTSEAWASAFETDMLGTVALVNAALPVLEKSKGCIVSISSTSGRDVSVGPPTPYGAFKAALTLHVAHLARELAPKGVRANTVSPGNIYFQDGAWAKVEQHQPDFFKAQMQKNPMGRMGRPEEVANAVVFLASPRASFITGTNVLVDGGLCTGAQF